MRFGLSLILFFLFFGFSKAQVQNFNVPKISSDAKIRINTMVDTNDGFKIAEVDLKLRGPGNIEGTQQSGTLDLRIANLATDGIILEEARKVAMNILEQDENLELPEHYPLKVFIQQKRQYNWSNIS